MRIDAESSATRESVFTEDFFADRRPLWIAGVLAIVFGILAIIFPIAASIGIELMVGLILTAFGVVELLRAFWLRRTGKIIGAALLGAVAIAAGLMLLAFPAAGLFSFSVILIAYFLVAGVFKLISAFQLRPHPSWKWTALSGAASLLLGVVLWAAMPGAALWVLGLLFGIDLLIFGFSQLALANAEAA